MTTKTDEQERAAFEVFASKHGLCVTENGDLYRSQLVAWMWKAWQAGRAALQSQPEIDEVYLSIVLDVYDNAMQKAFEGREFPNPCKPGTPEHKAWEKGSKEGKKKRDAGLPNSIALQSQDREDAERYRWLRDSDGLYDLPYKDHGIGPEFPRGEALDAAIDHARRVEGE